VPSHEASRFLFVGFLERQRASRPAPAAQSFPFPIHLHFHAPGAMVAEFAIELAAFPDGPQVFTRLPPNSDRRVPSRESGPGRRGR
jgi:hypothetical protein